MSGTLLMVMVAVRVQNPGRTCYALMHNTESFHANSSYKSLPKTIFLVSRVKVILFILHVYDFA